MCVTILLLLLKQWYYDLCVLHTKETNRKNSGYMHPGKITYKMKRMLVYILYWLTVVYSKKIEKSF